MTSIDDRSYLTTIAIAFAVSITCTALSLRFLAKKLQKITFGVDDYVMMMGAVSPHSCWLRTAD